MSFFDGSPVWWEGLHLMVLPREAMTHDEAPRYALRLARTLAESAPQHYILSAQASRRSRIFLDYVRNGRGTTAIGSYSPRVREAFPIAAPVTWSRSRPASGPMPSR
jgi:bifunctional non-homologous end joining protein LigD